MEIKIHSEKFERHSHRATVIPHRIISFKVGGRRLFFHHSVAVDRRGTHYGDTCESLTLIKNPNEYKRLRKQFVRKGQLGDEAIRALGASRTKCLGRAGGLDFPVEDSKWYERFGFRCRSLSY